MFDAGVDLSNYQKRTLFHEASKGGFKQWSIWIEPDGETVTVEWGLVGGALQCSSDTAKSKGKPGTKAFRTPQDCAKDNYDRQVRKKTEEGYRATTEASETIDYLSGLDKSFVPAKPRNDVTTAEIETLILDSNDGDIVIQRKRDGQRHLVLYTRTGEVRIYSRRLEDMTDRFPLMCQELKGLFPDGTIVDGEMFIANLEGHDDFKAVSNITKAKPDKAQIAERAHLTNLRFMAFDVLYYDGHPVWQEPYHERYAILDYKLTSYEELSVFRAPCLNMSFAEAQFTAKDEGWEGLVIWECHKPTVVRQGGKPKRVNCIKWKPIQETDVIAMGWEYGSGEMSDRVGVLNIAEYTPDGSQLRDCGKCGSGFDMQTRLDALSWSYPCVVTIEYDRQEPTGKFRFPVFIRCHNDKTPDECVGKSLENGD